MSTFKGVVAEFPQIRIDYFRPLPGYSPPLACFLSHVHSDHLTGLESLRAPFVYCSAPTREILLRLEKSYYRANFARGILESRKVTYDRSMPKLVKPLPLNAPTVIELAPGNNIRVTLLDANHCIGSVMFLIEASSKAILYTGDVRAEPWWVNSLVQNPVLLPYTLGHRRLHCMYLDTTFATKDAPYRQFPSKADGIRELLEKVSEYPDDTTFYFHSWTFGYENVWIALSAFLQSQIHLDDYRARIYASLSSLKKQHLREVGWKIYTDNTFLRDPTNLDIPEAPALCGFRNGNHTQPGCLTSQFNVRIHSCERGMGCPVVDNDVNARVVHIIPIVTRSSSGLEIAELGAGGGKDDLDQKDELETGNDDSDVHRLVQLCRESIKDEDLLAKALVLLHQILGPRKESSRATAVDIGLNLDLSAALQRESQDSDDDEPSIQVLISALASHAAKAKSTANIIPNPSTPEYPNRTIRFPYSRHSSYDELCGLVNAFKPRDVYPCTVDEEKWSPSLGMEKLFGKYCSGDIFRHDAEMMAVKRERDEWMKRGRNGNESQECSPDREEEDDNETLKNAKSATKRARLYSYLASETEVGIVEEVSNVQTQMGAGDVGTVVMGDIFADQYLDKPDSLDSRLEREQVNEDAKESSTTKENDRTGLEPMATTPSNSTPKAQPLITTNSIEATTTSISTLPSFMNTTRNPTKMSDRRIAYEAALGTKLTWADYGGLVSTRTKEDREEMEL